MMRIFNALLPNIDEVVATFGTIRAEKFNESHAELLLIRSENGQDYGYFVHLYRGNNGVWQIEGL